MPLKLENLRKLIATGHSEAALHLLSAQIGAYPVSIQEEFYWLSARWRGLQQLAAQEKLSASQSLDILELIQTDLTSLLEIMEKEDQTPLLASTENPEDDFQLTFISSRQRVRYLFYISPHQSLGYLKKALIKRFKIDTTAPPDSDNPEAYLVVNRTALMNDGLSLLEAGIKDHDVIQINVQYHKKMIWNQSVPTRIPVKFTGLPFVRPRLIINNKQKGKVISLTENELEIEFYTYDFTATVKDLLFNFRLLDGKRCLEFQEVLNAKGKLIDLDRISKQLAVSSSKVSYDLEP